MADGYIREYGMEERVSVMAGDYLTGDIGQEYDLIWACATLNFARHNLDPVIGKIFNALNPGGLFISFQDGMTHEQTRPDTMLGHLGDAMRMDLDIAFNRARSAWPCCETDSGRSGPKPSKPHGRNGPGYRAKMKRRAGEHPLQLPGHGSPVPLFRSPLRCEPVRLPFCASFCLI